MLRDWEIDQPGRINNIFRSICNVDLARLGDTNLYDFKNLTQAKADDEDPLFDSAEENDQINAVLNLIKSEGSRIEFVRNGK